MKIILLMLPILVLNCQTKKNINFGLSSNKEDSLKLIFKDIRENEINTENAQLYFNTFPKDFSSFEKIFGYDEKEMPDSLYFQSMDYIDVFTKTQKFIPLQTYMKRLINIGIRGKWDADGINYLQSVIQQNIKDNPQIFYNEYKKIPPQYQQSFWHFVLSGPHPEEAFKSNNEYNWLKIYPEMYLLITHELNIVSKEAETAHQKNE